MEAKRLSRECPYVLDMRGRAPGKIREVQYRERTFFVDDISHTLLKRGLEKTGGLFTVGLYEAIVNGPHTHRARQTREPDAAGAATSAPTGPGVMEFGYFHRRQEPRLNFAAEVRVIHNDFDFSAVTRNLSPSGLRVNLAAPYQFDRESRIGVELGALGVVGLGVVAYRVIKQITTGAATVDLMLRLAEERPEPVLAAIAAFIDERRGKYRLDADDALQTTSAFFHERLYADNDSQLPLFFGASREEPLRLDAVLASRHNNGLLEHFRCDGRFDFTPLTLPHRLEHLAAGGEMKLVVLRRADAGPCSWTDTETESEAEWRAVLEQARASDRQARVFYLRGVPIPREAIEKALARQRQLVDDGGTAVAGGEAILDRLRLLVRAADVTTEALTAEGTATAGTPPAWCGPQRQELHSGAVVARLDHWRTPSPLIPHVIYRGKRKEERYLARTRVSVSLNGGQWEGVTVDLSRGGMRVECEGVLPVDRDADVSLSLVSLQQKRPDLDLSCIPYRVANLDKGEQATTLMLARQMESIRDPLKGFFDELFETNRAKLKMDRADVESTALARLLGSVGTTELTTLPFFVRLDRDGSVRVEHCVVNRPPNALAAIFQTESGGYDFSAFASDDFVRHLNRCLRSRRGKEQERPCEFGYLFQRTAEGTRGAPLDWTRAAQLARTPTAHTARFTKVAIKPVEPFSELEVEQAVLSIFEQSHFKALRFREMLDAVVGVGEVIDLTGLMREG